ncbi:MAG: hypothetical protein HYR60_29930 [Acidobacteria bacterium]|nr:hypothetical protein [Acidobacteriota bacterium]
MFWWVCAAALLVAEEPPRQEAAPASQGPTPQRAELNLLGKTDTQSGESRRNENIQFNPIDNNALKELNQRMGTTATIVQEFRPERAYFGVEFGNPPPAPLHVAASKGSGVHGEVREAHGNSVFSARSFFQAGSVKPAHENDYGFSFGAGLWKGAQASLEGGQQKIRGSVNGNVLAPRLEERTPLTADPAVRRILERFFAAYPRAAPNRTDIDPRALNTNAPQSIDTSSGSVRLDQQLGERDRVTLRHTFTSQQVDAFQLIDGQNPDTSTRSHSSRITWSRIFSAATHAEFSAGFDRVHSLLVPEPNAVGPSVTIGTAIEKLGPSSGVPIDRVQNRFRYAAMGRHARGRHTFTFGGELARVQYNGRETSSNRGVLTFRNDFGRDALTNFRMGIPSRFSTGIGELNRGFRHWERRLFAGDTWRVGANLTLNYGVRYQPVTGPYEVHGVTQIPFHCDCNNLAPTLGFAYHLPGEWGLLRGAYGTHYGEIFPVTLQQLRWNPPGFLKVEVQEPDLVNPLRNADLSPNARSTLFVLPADLRTPYSHQYNFSWEAPAKANWKLQLGYVGSRTHKLFMLWYTNRARPVTGIAQTTATINERRPNPGRFEIRRVLNGSRAYFDAARVSLAAPNWHSLSVDAAYWFSKALDLGAGYLNTAAGDDARQGASQSEGLLGPDLKGPSAFDQSHSVLVRFAYATPALAHKPLRGVLGRWNLSLVFLGKTGTPFSVISGSDGPGYGNVDGSSGDRPNLVDPSILGRSVTHPDGSVALLPRSAFRFIAPTGDRGNLGLSTFRRGGIRNLNAGISRTWTVSAEKTVTLRAESVNFFNTPQFADPSNDLTSPSFGQITNTLNDGRTFQFQMRFRF